MNIEEMQQEKMFAFIAPDGAVQTSTIAHDREGCYAITKLMAEAGYGQSPAILSKKGFRIMPVSVTIVSR